VSTDPDRAVEAVGPDRRTFVRRLVVGSAFAVPVVASFSMAGVQAVYAQTPGASGQPSSTAPGSTTSSSSTTTTTISNSNLSNF
jgi:hypothetical protein